MALEVSIRKRLGSFQLEAAFETDGGVLALLGASGCGKSMTLKCIAGIETPDSGRIVLDGRVLFDSAARVNLPPQKRRVGYLFQQYALFPNMTVRQNIAAGIRAKAGREARVAELVRAMYLEGEEHKYPAQLSGGQQQRVALARVLASGPELLMLDEPFTALDSYLRWRLELGLADALADYGRPVLFVSHSRDEVYRLCQRVCLMERGRTEPVMPVRDLFESPGTVPAALLSGCKNFAHARRLDAHSVYAEEWGVTLACARAVPEDVRAVGIRAHHVALAEGPGPNTVECEVVRVVEDVFSTVVMLRPIGALPGGDWRMLRVELDKGALALPSAPQRLRVRLAPQWLMPLR